MTVFDIVVGIIAVIAVINGWRRGFAVQAVGLAAIIIGIVVAVRTGAEAGARLGIDGRYAAVAGYLLVFLCVTVALMFIGRLVRKMFRFAGLGVVDVLLGILLSLLKVALVLGILCTIFDKINDGAQFVPRSSLDRSLTYRPLCRVVTTLGVLGGEMADGTTSVVEKTLDNI